MESINHWIGGKPFTDAPTRTGDVFNPATGAVKAQVSTRVGGGGRPGGFGGQAGFP